jgi:lysophospholipid acyltransferase (LPLAT)-like uncharacterized protein
VKEAIKAFLRGKVGTYLIATYLRLVYFTSRKVYIPPRAETEAGSRRATIYANWHGQNFLFPFWFRGRPASNALVAFHGDGQMIGQAIGVLGLKLIHGSGGTNKGGAKAFLQMLRALRRDETIIITADVPKDARIVGDGVLLLARKSKAPIVPLAIATSRRHIIGNWDKTQIHLPFSRLVYYSGAEIVIPDDGTPLEDHRENLRLALEDVQAKAFAAADNT